MREIDYDDLVIREVPVKISGVRYVLREASGDVAVRYRDACLRASRMQGGKVVGVDGLANSEPLLVAGCLFRVKPDGKGEEPVSERIIRGWPQRVQRDLFDTAKQISDLEDHDSAERLALLEAFRQSDAPCTLEEIREWAGRLKERDEDKWAPLVSILEPTAEEKAKKEQPAGVDGSALPTS